MPERHSREDTHHGVPRLYPGYTHHGVPRLYPPWYIRLPVASRVHVRPCTTQFSLIDAGILHFLVRGLKSRGFSRRKGTLLTLRINHFLPGNRLNMAKKPATERRVAQGRRESLNPSRSDARPPSRLEDAFFTLLITLGPGPMEGHLSYKTVFNSLLSSGNPGNPPCFTFCSF